MKLLPIVGVNGTQTGFPSGPGSYRIQLLNLVPDVKYELRAQLVKVSRLPAPFTPLGALAVTCTSALENEVTAAQAEERIAELRATFRSRLAQAGCSEDEIAKFATDFDAKTTFTSEAIFVQGDDEDLIVTVERPEQDRKRDGHHFEKRTFGEFTFAATRKSQSTWLTLYGFNYIKNGDQPYFAKAGTGTPTPYTVTPGGDRRDRDFAPSVYFMWVPERNAGFPFSLAGWHRGEQMFGGFSAGIGFDTEAPTAFFGYGVGWGSNVMVTAGLAYHQEKRLASRYNPGDVISDNLTEDQLTEKTYKPRAYIGFAFRFGENPWKKSEPKPQ